MFENEYLKDKVRDHCHYIEEYRGVAFTNVYVVTKIINTSLNEVKETIFKYIHIFQPQQ